MEGTLEARTKYFAGNASSGFQSISSWKVLWKRYPAYPPSRTGSVSIHLFMEGTLEEEYTHAHQHQKHWFQSISSWKVLWKRMFDWSNRYFPNSFNPSLHGRYSGSFWALAFSSVTSLFQSISSWKVLWKLYSPLAACRVAAVSIHLFMEGTLEELRRYAETDRTAGVSIHLFMEGTLEENLSFVDSLIDRRFNPSLHGRYSGRQTCILSREGNCTVSIHLFMEGTLEVPNQ